MNENDPTDVNSTPETAPLGVSEFSVGLGPLEQQYALVWMPTAVAALNAGLLADGMTDVAPIISAALHVGPNAIITGRGTKSDVDAL
jgi:hypothetical protein